MSKIAIDELWAMNVSAATLYNIERAVDDNPEGGGGATYIQIGKSLVPDLLTFLRSGYPAPGQTIDLSAGDMTRPTLPPQPVVFQSKSQERMRISNQNRHRASRHPAWSPASGFPTLGRGQRTPAAQALLDRIGGLRIFIARAPDSSCWAGFTTGAPDRATALLPFANIAYGKRGGYWKHTPKP